MYVYAGTEGARYQFSKDADMTVTIFSKSACVQCSATYRELDRLGIAYTVLDVEQDNAAREQMIDLGYRQLPVVMAGDAHWSGFQPDRLRALS